MATVLEVAADLAIEVSVAGQEPVRARLRGSGNRLQLDVDDPGAFAGRGDEQTIRAFAEMMAGRGIVVRVVSHGVHLVTLGATTAPWWQRRATGSRRIRVGSLRGAWTAARARGQATSSLLPDARLAPPSTMWPLVPTFQRRPRRAPTTTHDPARGGGARLVVALGDSAWAGQRQSVFWLNDDVTTIGSDSGCDIVLPGLQRLHAEVHHDDKDEFVIFGRSLEIKVNGARTQQQLLRTGSRVQLAEWTLSFYREEFADHGRPHGGRVGGEFGRQLPQPSREDLT